MEDFELLTNTKRNEWPLELKKINGYTGHYGLHLYIRFETSTETFLAFIGNGNTFKNPSITDSQDKEVPTSKDSKQAQFIRLIQKGLTQVELWREEENNQQIAIEYYVLEEHKEIDESRKIDKAAKERKSLQNSNVLIKACEELIELNKEEKKNSIDGLWNQKVISRQMWNFVANRGNLQDQMFPLLLSVILETYGEPTQEFENYLDKTWGKWVAPEIPSPAILMMIGPFVCLADFVIILQYNEKVFKNQKIDRVILEFIEKHLDILGQMYKDPKIKKEQPEIMERIEKNLLLSSILNKAERWSSYEKRREECFVKRPLSKNVNVA